jgi:hypothetical protein
MDSMEIEFQYEPEPCLISNGVVCLPDFYLPHIRFFAEVKPDAFTPEEIWKAEELARGTSRQTLMLVGPPDYRPYDGLTPDCGYFTSCPYSLDIHATEHYANEGRLFSCPDEVSQKTCSPQYRKSIEASRAERFGK